MIFRFSLYGFLKNQRYFEAFLVLAFLDRGLDYLAIGLLVACKQLAVTCLEIPSGAIADVFGRKRTMIGSLAAYIASFALLGFGDGFWWLAVGMVLYGVGDSFRSGTHKAMIFAWLTEQGRTDERVSFYGYTRSWSKFGSAISVVGGTTIVLVTGGYRGVFLAPIVPYVAGIVNLLGYPASLDMTAGATRSLGGVGRHLAETLGVAARNASVRRLIVEAMGFDGVFAAVKDYLQPVLAAAAIVAVGGGFFGDLGGLDETDPRHAAILVGPIYVVLFLLAGLASRRSHQLSKLAGNEERAARWLWGTWITLFAVLLVAGWFDITTALIIGFVGLHVLQNLWRPILISRFDAHTDERHGASILSIESQAQRFATMLLAPLIGWGVDRVVAGEFGGTFWPIGAVGIAIALVVVITGWGRLERTA